MLLHESINIMYEFSSVFLLLESEISISPCDQSGVKHIGYIYEPHHEKTCFMHMQKQRRRSASSQLVRAFVFST